VALVFGFEGTGRRVRNDSNGIYRLLAGRIFERWWRERRSTRDLLVEALKEVRGC
jgi:hypothetical protein